MSQIAILGAGAMGSRLVQNLLQQNYSVVIYNRTVEKVSDLLDQGATYAETPRKAAEQADIVISMVTNDHVSRILWLDPETGAAAGLSNSAIAIESSTLTVNWIKELATAIERQGAAFLDAPVVGSRPQAETRNLIYLVGGSVETLAPIKPILTAAGGLAIHHVGTTGQGMAMKLAVNALFGIQVAALAELIGMLTQQGITSAKAMECLGELPVLSPAAKGAGSLMLKQNHAPLFPVALVEKDFHYAIQTAQAVNAHIPVSTAVRDIYREAIAHGYENDNITGVAQLFISKH